MFSELVFWLQVCSVVYVVLLLAFGTGCTQGPGGGPLPAALVPVPPPASDAFGRLLEWLVELRSTTPRPRAALDWTQFLAVSTLLLLQLYPLYVLARTRTFLNALFHY